MKSTTTPRFRKLLERLPQHIHGQAHAAYHRFRQNPNHPGLQFKPIQGVTNVYSVRISIAYRAIGLWEDDEITWFWIGPHHEYDRLLDQLRR